MSRLEDNAMGPEELSGPHPGGADRLGDEPAWRRLLRRARVGVRDRPGYALLGITASLFAGLVAVYGLSDVAQRTLNGLVAGSYFALGAVGLTLVYGILKLVNFAHGDMLTFGAYMALLFSAGLGLPSLVAMAAGVLATAGLGLAIERLLWRPMRRKRAGLLQLLLTAIGLALFIRSGIQFVAGTAQRSLDVDVLASVEFLGLRIGTTELIVVVVGVAVLTLVAVLLRVTSVGRQMRALSDNFSLAETTGVDTSRIVALTWVFGAGLAGLAGVLYAAAAGSFNPNLGFLLLLTLFAAVILGGIGNAYGALVGGMFLGLTQEWSTLVIDSRWKIAIGFVILIMVLIVRPNGLFGRAAKI